MFSDIQIVIYLTVKTVDYTSKNEVRIKNVHGFSYVRYSPLIKLIIIPPAPPKPLQTPPPQKLKKKKNNNKKTLQKQTQKTFPI